MGGDIGLKASPLNFEPQFFHQPHDRSSIIDVRRVTHSPAWFNLGICGTWVDLLCVCTGTMFSPTLPSDIRIVLQAY